jgi:hypothetical protein
VDFCVRNTRKPECAILYNLPSLADEADDILFLEFLKNWGGDKIIESSSTAIFLSWVSYQDLTSFDSGDNLYFGDLSIRIGT